MDSGYGLVTTGHGTGSAVGNLGLSEWGNSWQTLLSAATEDLAALLKQVKQALSVPVAG